MTADDANVDLVQALSDVSDRSSNHRRIQTTSIRVRVSPSYCGIMWDSDSDESDSYSFPLKQGVKRNGVRVCICR